MTPNFNISVYQPQNNGFVAYQSDVIHGDRLEDYFQIDGNVAKYIFEVDYTTPIDDGTFGKIMGAPETITFKKGDIIEGTYISVPEKSESNYVSSNVKGIRTQGKVSIPFQVRNAPIKLYEIPTVTTPEVVKSNNKVVSENTIPADALENDKTILGFPKPVGVILILTIAAFGAIAVYGSIKYFKNTK